MSKTIDDIKKLVYEQDLSTKCSCETQESFNYFLNFVTSSGIETRSYLLRTANALVKYPIYHIRYDEAMDEFEFNVDYFSKSNGQIVWLEEIRESVKWIPTVGNEYGLRYASGYKTGEVLKSLIPVIIKNA
jgi:hypothetical protein